MPDIKHSSKNQNSERPVGLRTRGDLQVSESVFQGEPSWIIKDPVALKYFRLREPEYLVFEALRKEISFSELRYLLESRFTDKILKLETIQSLVVSMHRSGLLLSNATGQARPLQKRRSKEQRQKAVGLLSSIVSMRFPGVDPDRFLSWLHPKLRWFFTPAFSAVVLATCLAAIALVLVNFDQFVHRLPDFQNFFAVDNLLFMGFVLVFTKSIHELGHGLMCKHFGGECHEIGFMMMVLSPAMYCDTSDSWILPNRWHRMAIGAAGMYVEVFLAAIATFVWWYTNPGWLHYFALNLMFLSSVTTVLFNANPLLRYDGYFILSDYLEIPNLSQKAKLAMTSTARVWCLGMKPVDQRQLPEQRRFAFASYCIASFLYRWFVMLMIFWFLREVFVPLGLGVFANLVISISLFGMLGLPLVRLIKFFLSPGRLRDVKPYKLLRTMVIATAILAAIVYVPIPHYVFGHARIRPKDGQWVSVSEGGFLHEVKVGSGERVQAGDILAVLKNPELEFEVEALKSELSKLKSDLLGYEANRSRNIDSERMISETRVEIRNLQAKLTVKQKQFEKLTLRAKRGGIVMHPGAKPREPQNEWSLSTWHGFPLSQKNTGAYFEPNTLVCMIADPGENEAIVLVDQSDVKLIETKQTVTLVLESSRDKTFKGHVLSVSNDEISEVPQVLSQTYGGSIPVKPRPEGGEMPILKMYEIHATLDSFPTNHSSPTNQPVVLNQGTRGKAKLLVGYASLGSLTVRYLQTLINFR